MSDIRTDGRGACIVLSAASGGGKSTVSRLLVERNPSMATSVSATTRAPRPGEIDGVHYFFLDEKGFSDLVESGGMLEHATVFGRRYGVPRAPVEKALSQGRDILFVVDWQGHRAIRRELPGDVLGIFLKSPSMEELASRLRTRGDDPETVASRMAQAESEESHADEFDHVVVNDRIEDTVARVEGCIAAFHDRRVHDILMLRAFSV